MHIANILTLLYSQSFSNVMAQCKSFIKYRRFCQLCGVMYFLLYSYLRCMEVISNMYAHVMRFYIMSRVL